MAEYEIVIHVRDSAEPVHITLPGVPEHEAETERQTLIVDLEEARRAEAPVVSIQTSSGFPVQPLDVDPHAVIEVDLREVRSDRS